ncbi:MAG: hypothetical protein KGL39_19640 [Patescibacteria group bacterium]|nr:hypothetical protein [Patescibacteria group bacterium]
MTTAIEINAGMQRHSPLLPDGKITHRTIVADDGSDATSWPEHEWDAEEFLRGGFMVNRCYVPPWAFQPNNALTKSHENEPQKKL